MADSTGLIVSIVSNVSGFGTDSVSRLGDSSIGSNSILLAAFLSISFCGVKFKYQYDRNKLQGWKTRRGICVPLEEWTEN